MGKLRVSKTLKKGSYLNKIKRSPFSYSDVIHMYVFNSNMVLSLSSNLTAWITKTFPDKIAGKYNTNSRNDF